MSGETENPMLTAALSYAKRGWRVLPLHTATGDPCFNCTCGRTPCPSPGKHPRTPHGVKDATVNKKQIRKWWEKWPAANIGIATGAESGFVVLDIDGPWGEKVLRQLGHEIPDTVFVGTGRGRHIYFKHPGGTVRNVTGLFGTDSKIDLKGDSGYVVAPPSMHASGVEYEMFGDLDDPLAECPKWLLDALQDVSGVRQERDANSGKESGAIREGSRNSTLTSMAGKLRRVGLSGQELEVTLQSLNHTRCDPPLPDSEVTTIARSVSQYTPSKPDAEGRLDTARRNAERAKDSGLFCNGVMRYHDNEAKMFLAQLCREMEGLQKPDDEPWYLSCRKAKEVLEMAGYSVEHTIAAAWLRDFVKNGFLEIVVRGGPTTNKATRYRCLVDPLRASA